MEHENKPQFFGVAYLAGVFDGEGSLSLYKSMTGSTSGKPTYSLVGQITNRCIPLLESTKLLYGGTVGIRKDGCGVWRVISNDLDRFFSHISPSLFIKKHLFELALQYRQDCPSNPGGRGRTEEMLSTQENYYLKFKEAQRRWKP